MSTKTKQYKLTCIYDRNLNLNSTPRDRIALEGPISKSAYNLLKVLATVRSHDGDSPVLNKLYSLMVNGEPCLAACDGYRLMVVRLSQEPFTASIFRIPMDRFWEIDLHKDSIYLTDQTRAMNFLGYDQYFKFDNLMLNLNYANFLIEIDKYSAGRKNILSPSVRIAQLCASEFKTYYNPNRMPIDNIIDPYKDKALVGVNEWQNNQLHIECNSFVFVMIPTQESDYFKVMPDSQIAGSVFFKKPLVSKSLFPDWSLNNASSK